MTINPAKLLGLPSGRLEKGAPADLILVDLGQPWVVDKARLKSRSKNSPFDERKCKAACSPPGCGRYRLSSLAPSAVDASHFRALIWAILVFLRLLALLSGSAGFHPVGWC